MILIAGTNDSVGLGRESLISGSGNWGRIAWQGAEFIYCS